MLPANNPPDDAVEFVERLEPEALREQLRQLDRQSRAVRTLLRAVIARERALDKRRGKEEAGHA
jgi:hypothetical protein